MRKPCFAPRGKDDILFSMNDAMFTASIEGLDLRRTADSGQCFRMNMMPDGTCRVLHADQWVSVQETAPGEFRFSCDKAAFDGVWRWYFDLDSDYALSLIHI